MNDPADSSARSTSMTLLLKSWRNGDDEARDQLMQSVYDELRRIAARRLRHDRAAVSIAPTELVHELYGRLATSQIAWEDRVHFFALASRTMRRILRDHIRSKQAAKRGAGARQVTLSDFVVGNSESTHDLLVIDQALEHLATFDERKARAVELHYFGGLNYRELSHVLGVSEATVDRDLRMAKLWLAKELATESSDSTSGKDSTGSSPDTEGTKDMETED